MARIRSIKPEFWTDERLTECSVSARLLFIGMLNFADDNGNQVYSAKRLKMQVFPADTIDTQPLIDELITHGLLIEYSVSGNKYLNIKGFKKHQVINRRSSTPIPEPDFSDGSLSAHGAGTDGEEGKGEERKEQERSASSDDDAPERSDSIPYREIVAAYNRTMTGLPKVRELTDARRTAIRRVWQESTQRQSLAFWLAFFAECHDDPFLSGTGPYREPHANWRPDFDYLVQRKVATKVYERAMDRMERES